MTSPSWLDPPQVSLSRFHTQFRWEIRVTLWLVHIVSGSRGLGPIPGWVNVLCTWAEQFILTMCICPKEYKWVLTNCQGSLMKCKGVTLLRVSFPFREDTPRWGGWVGHLAVVQTFPFLTIHRGIHLLLL